MLLTLLFQREPEARRHILSSAFSAVCEEPAQRTKATYCALLEGLVARCGSQLAPVSMTLRRPLPHPQYSGSQTDLLTLRSQHAPTLEAWVASLHAVPTAHRRRLVSLLISASVECVPLGPVPVDMFPDVTAVIDMFPFRCAPLGPALSLALRKGKHDNTATCHAHSAPQTDPSLALRKALAARGGGGGGGSDATGHLLATSGLCELLRRRGGSSGGADVLGALRSAMQVRYLKRGYLLCCADLPHCDSLSWYGPLTCSGRNADGAVGTQRLVLVASSR